MVDDLLKLAVAPKVVEFTFVLDFRAAVAMSQSAPEQPEGVV